MCVETESGVEDLVLYFFEETWVGEYSLGVVRFG